MSLLGVYINIDQARGERGSVLLDREGRFTDALTRALKICWRRGVEVVLTSAATSRTVRDYASLLLGSSSYICESGYGVALGPHPLDFLHNTGTWRRHGDRSVRAQIEEQGAVRLLFRAFPGLRYDYSADPGRLATIPLEGSCDVARANVFLLESGFDLEILDPGPLGGPPGTRRYLLAPRGALPGVRLHMARRGYAENEVAAVGGSREDFQASLYIGHFYLLANVAEADPELRDSVIAHPTATVTKAGYQAGVLEAFNDALGRSRAGS
jgi:hypothetical protein